LLLSFLFILALNDHIDLRGAVMPSRFAGIELTAYPLVVDWIARR
jgi:hypothetical protein